MEDGRWSPHLFVLARNFPAQFPPVPYGRVISAQ